jgi:hypothetical protein
MRRRSDFFLQPLESRTLLSGASASAGDRAGANLLRADAGASSPPLAPVQKIDEQVAQLRSALAEMADRMQRFEQIAHADPKSGQP